jgi:hypothetical protein
MLIQEKDKFQTVLLVCVQLDENSESRSLGLSLLTRCRKGNHVFLGH